ncbi:universal stress protein [Variovorax sp. PBL-E5]|uniref:universal stress protein n=1 Tax=Variovorax sp. PBL-E5 TaxID=434014 RepID=UPI00131828BF|nr:universal stress protein [Variovorax sp. PBL-E5]VTU22174.1 Universal stress protein family protein [Variovorax sp. PBL-E5]
MNFRTILVHLDPTDRCPVRVRLAAGLARAHGSHLVGLVPTGLYDGAIPIGAIPTGASDFIAESSEHLRRRANAIAEEFREQAAGPGPLSSEIRRVDGSTVDAVVNHGRASDLIVLGQGDRSNPADAPLRELAQQAMLQTGRPILMVPFAGHFDKVGEHAVIAWDGSRESAVAMRQALPLLRRAARVTLLSFHRLGEAPDGGKLLVPEMTHWLLRHGVQVKADQEAVDIDIDDALLSRSTDLGADLLVMGGYGHSRFRELMLGGVTRGILEKMTLPALLAH